MMLPAHSPQGDRALAALLRTEPLFGFDFDGTLAPIVDDPASAGVPRQTVEALSALAARAPVAVVSGRAAADVQSRLGFEPAFIVGNHGSEGTSLGLPSGAPAAMEAFREKLELHAADLRHAGVAVEDKGGSFALHYRNARDPALARACVNLLATSLGPGLHHFDGKSVLNIVPAGAPDKADAMAELVRRAHCGGAFFAGDDVNDEPVFARAPEHWVTVRVGADGPPSKARFFIDGPQAMPALLQRILALSS